MPAEATFCGTGGWNGPKPGDPDNNAVLAATPAFGGIDVSWTYPVTNPFAVAHIKLYRAAVPNFLYAYLLGHKAGDFFYDRIETVNTYSYWIQFVSVNGTEGALIGPATATSRLLIDQTIEQLTGKIDAGVLATSLRAELDKISALNTNLLNEITARENSNITLAQAMNAANAGVAQALTFIASENTSRTTADTALLESLNLSAVTLNGNIAAVSTTLTASINAVTGSVDAMYTAQVNVNGLVGGFGIHNNGAQVEAGFDVDTFWIGRTSLNKRKPFIVVGNETFIDEAVINKLTFSKLRAADGSFVVENGRLKAQHISGVNLDVVNGTFSGSLQGATGTFSGDVWANNFYTTSGRFIAYADGRVIADTVDIRRRIVLQNGTTDPQDLIGGISSFDEFGNTIYFPPGTTFHGNLNAVVLTDIYDSNSMNPSANQPYYVAADFRGSVFREYSGSNGATFRLTLAAAPCIVRTYSNTGVYADDYRLGIKFTYTIYLVSGSFNSFKLPTTAWTLFRL